MEALAAMADRLNQSLDAFNKHLTSMDASIQHSEAVMGERLSAMALARRIRDDKTFGVTPRGSFRRQSFEDVSHASFPSPAASTTVDREGRRHE